MIDIEGVTTTRLFTRQMMKQWVAWLEEQAAATVAADPTLLDRDAVAELVYKKRYGERRWKAALKAARDGKLPWAA